MEDKIVFITKDGLPDPVWISGLSIPILRQTLGSWVFSSQDPLLFFHCQEVDLLQNLNFFQKESIHWHCIVLDQFNLEFIQKVQDLNLNTQILFSFDPNLVSKIQKIRNEFQSFQNEKALQKKLFAEHREIQDMNSNLEVQVFQRTQQDELIRRQLEDQLKKIRSFVRWIQDLLYPQNFEGFLKQVYRDLAKEGPIHGGFFARQLGNVLELHELKPLHRKLHLPIQLDADLATPQFLNSLQASALVQVLERPCLSFVVLTLKEPDIYLILEVDPQKIDWVLNLNEMKKIVWGQAFDRFESLEKIRYHGLRWERTFDSFVDPVGIIDLDHKVLRSNKSFQNFKSEQLCYQKFLGRQQPCNGCPMQDHQKNSDLAVSKIENQGRYFQLYSYPLKSESDFRVTTFVHHYVDVTDQRKLQMQVLQSEKMGAIGLLAGNIAHELNNPLTGIRALVQIIKAERTDKGNSSDQIWKDLSEIEKAADRSLDIIKNLLDFTSETSDVLKTVGLDDMVKKTLPMLKTLMRHHRLLLELDTPSYQVQVVPSLFQQVVFNLVNNACQALGQKPGNIRLKTVYESETQTVIFSVKDDGPGISSDLKDKIFQSFFTTKPEGQGTGLGLSLSQSMVERWKGKMFFTSSESMGTEFFVRLPVITH